MARGRLASVTIPPYSSSKVYTNSSGNEASVTLNTVVLDASACSEISVAISTNSNLQTSSIGIAQTACTPWCCISSFSYCTDSACQLYSGYYAKPSCTGCTPCVTGCYFPNYVDSSGNVTSFVSRRSDISICCQSVCFCSSTVFYCSGCTGNCYSCTYCYFSPIVGLSTNLTFDSTLTNRNAYENPEFLLQSNICKTSNGTSFPVISIDCNGCVNYFSNSTLTTPNARAKHFVNPKHSGSCTPTGSSCLQYFTAATDYWSTEKMTLGIYDANYITNTFYERAQYFSPSCTSCCCENYACTNSYHLLAPKWAYTWVEGSTICNQKICDTATPCVSWYNASGASGTMGSWCGLCYSGSCASCICMSGGTGFTLCGTNISPGLNDFSTSYYRLCQCGIVGTGVTALTCSGSCCIVAFNSLGYNPPVTKFFVNESGPSVLAGCNIFAYQKQLSLNYNLKVVGFVAACGSTLRDVLSCACRPTTEGANCSLCGSYNRTFGAMVCTPPFDPNTMCYSANPVKWMTYNPNTSCNYFMLHVGTVVCSCNIPCQNGIYSICHSTICSVTTCNYPSACFCCSCVSKVARSQRLADECGDVTLCDTSPYGPTGLGFQLGYLAGCNFCCGSACRYSTAFTRVGSLPSEFVNCCFYCFCPSPLIRTGNCEWKFGVYENGAWVDYVSCNLTCWQRQCSYYGCTDGLLTRTPYNLTLISCNTCILQICECFYNVISNSEYLDYRDNVNAVERTGLIVSDQDSIYVSNGSNQNVSVQVWGYEG